MPFPRDATSICDYIGSCECIPDDQFFRLASLVLLCQLSSNTSTNGYVNGVTKTQGTCSLDMTNINSNCLLNTSREASVSIQVGSFSSGTVSFEGSLDEGATWFTLQGVNNANAPVTSTTSAGQFFFNVATLTRFRSKVSIVGVGTPAIYSVMSPVAV